MNASSIAQRHGAGGGAHHFRGGSFGLPSSGRPRSDPDGGAESQRRSIQAPDQGTVAPRGGVQGWPVPRDARSRVEQEPTPAGRLTHWQQQLVAEPTSVDPAVLRTSCQGQRRTADGTGGCGRPALRDRENSARVGTNFESRIPIMVWRSISATPSEFAAAVRDRTSCDRDVPRLGRLRREWAGSPRTDARLGAAAERAGWGCRADGRARGLAARVPAQRSGRRYSVTTAPSPRRPDRCTRSTGGRNVNPGT